MKVTLRALVQKTALVSAAFILAVSSLTALGPFVLSERVGAVSAAAPSENGINKTKGWAYAEEVGKTATSVTLKFTSTRNFLSCFEYRADGVLPPTSNPNPNTEITDGRWLYKCVSANGVSGTQPTETVVIPAVSYVETRMVFGAEKNERFDWTRFDVSMTPDTTLVVHKNSANLVGAEFTVSGDAIAAGGLNRVYVQLVHRETSTRYGGTTINLIGQGTSASWSRLYKAAADGLPEGTYAAHVAVVDMAGRVTDVGWTDNFVLDKTDATFEIITPLNNSLVRGLQRVSAKITDTNGTTKVLMNVGDGAGNYVWEADKTNNKVTRDGDTFYLDVDTTTLPNGVNYVVLRATDGAGNTRYFNNNANTRIHSYIVDNEAPTAEIVAPSLANGDVVIKGIGSDNHGIKSHWFEVKAPNGTLYYKNFPSNSATEVTFNLSEASRTDGGVESFAPIVGGEYTIRYVVTDLAGNRNDDPGYTNSEIHTLTIDKTRPVVTLLSPTQSVFNSTGVLLEVQATDNIAVQKVVANIYKDGVLFKSTQSTAPVDTADYTHSVDLGTVLSGNPLPEGTYYVKYNALDTAGNMSETKTFNFKVDTTGPTITVKEGSSFTVGNETLGVYSKVSFSLFDANKVDKLTLNGVEKDLTDNNYSDLNFVQPGAFGAIEGVNTLVVYDVSGNSTTLTFTLDTKLPVISNISIIPTINGNVGGAVTVYFDITDDTAVDFDKTYVLFADGPNTANQLKESVKVKPVHVSGDSYKAEFDSFQFVKANFVGNYNLQFTYADAAGNRSSTKPVAFRGILVDNSGPTSVWTAPHNGDVLNGVVRFNFDVSDHTGVLSGYVKLNGATSSKQVNLMHESGGVWYADIDTTELTDGAYTVDARFVDSFNRPRYGANKGTVVVDNIAPIVQLIAPVGDIFNHNVDVRGIVSDANLRHYWLSVFHNGTQVVNRTVLSSGITSDFLLYTASAEGAYTVTLAARDLAGGTDRSGNRSVDVIKTFTIDKTAPAAPSNLGWTNTNGAVANGGTTNLYEGVASWDASEDTDVAYYIYQYWNDGSTHTETNPWTTSVSGLSLPGVFNQGQGTHYFSVIAVDHAGNKSSPNETFTITYDSIAPDAPEILAADANGANGTAAPGSRVFVRVGDDEYEDVADENGDWSVVFVPALTEGSHTITVVATDDADNTSNETTLVAVVPPAIVDEEEEADNLAAAFAPPSAIGPTDVLGDADQNTDDAEADIKGSATESNLAQAVNSDANQGKLWGVDWYWWLLILAGLATIVWWAVAAVSRRNDDQ